MTGKIRKTTDLCFGRPWWLWKNFSGEMLLFQAKVISRLGKIEEGTTCLDYEPEEIKRRGSIQPGFAHFSWQKSDHFLVDIPGDGNFNGDIQYLLKGVDGVVFVLDAIDGVKPLTKKMWMEVEKAQLPALIFINKMDRERANFEQALEGLSSILGIKAVPLFLPIGAEADFKGVVDVLEQKALFFEEDGKVKKGDIPAELADQVEELRMGLIEDIAESDEALMEKYLEEGELSKEELLTGLRKGILNRELFPVTVGAALVNKGGNILLDTINWLLPSPLEHAPFEGEDGSERKSSEEEP